MADNASYMQRELSGVEMPGGCLERAQETCDRLLAGRDAAMAAILRLQVLLRGLPDSEAEVVAGIQRITTVLGEPLGALNGLVQQLRSASQEDQRYGLALILFAESGTNILTAFNSTVDAERAVR